MSERPSGTVTFLFTDVEGSTRLWDEHPEAMEKALHIHDELLRSTVEGRGGYVFSTAGDAFAVAFSDPRQALAAAIQAQSLLGLQEWPQAASLRVRMALHSGIAAERDGDYFGTAPSRCARVMAVAGGGQILLTEATHGMLKDDRIDGVAFRDLGQHQLRDLTAPERIFSVVHPGLSAAPETIRSLTTLPNNLPVQLTSFVGRHQELEEAAKLLRGSRLLTLAGVGGSGKTRLALQVAAEALEEFADGVWLVELAPVTEASGVIRAVTNTLSVTEQPERSLEELLIEQIRHRQLLLIFDNCEHLIDEVARLTDRLLAAAPHLRILATSREMLGVPGETPYQLRSMKVPDEGVPLSSLAGFDAVQLFASRGEVAQAGFRITESNAATVVQLCKRLDGMPLALELAAARLRVLSPEQIAARLDDRFRLLTGGSRTALPRQQTLEAAIDWSYDLLSDREKKLFDRLSVFQGGFTLEAAERVCVGDGVEEAEILDLLSRLVDKSLVAVGEGIEGPRYRMLETLRQYGRERLTKREETEPVRRRHAAYFHGLIEQALPHLRGPEEERWGKRLESEHDNFRQALRWSIDAGEAEMGQSLAGLLYRFWMLYNHVSEGRDWLDQVMAVGTGSALSRRRAALGAGTLAMVHHELATARPLLEEARDAMRAADDGLMMTAALNNLASVLMQTDDLEAAREVFWEELDYGRRTNGDEAVTFALENLADVELSLGNHDQARGMFDQAIEAARAFGSRIRLSDVLAHAGMAMLNVDDLEAGSIYLRELLTLGSHQFAPGRHRTLWGLLLGRQGRIFEAFGELQHLSNFRTLPDYQKLSGVLREAFVQWARIELDGGRPERAAIIVAGAEHLSAGKRLRFEQDFYHRTLNTIEERLSPAAFEQAWQKGALMSIDDLLDYCLAEEPPSGPDRADGPGEPFDY